jgi:Stage II sporulation protein E (SpoIIE)
MRGRIGFPLIVACIAGVFVQTASATTRQQGLAIATAANQVAPVQFADSAQTLTQWKFRPGDDPAYAQPGYDDSGWHPVSIDVQPNTHDPYYSSDSYIPGWTARGFPNLSGFAWYRTRVTVEGLDSELWVEMPPDVDDGYELYANGQLVGSMGRFRPDRATVFYSRPLAFRLPSPDPKGSILIALRFYMAPDSPLWNFDAGGLHAPPVIGLRESISLLQEKAHDTILHTVLAYLPLCLLALLAGIVSLWIYAMDRSEQAYLWLTLAFILEAALSLSTFLAEWTYWITSSAEVLITDVLASVLIPALWLLFWTCWLRLRALRLLAGATWTLVALELCCFACLRNPIMGSLISVRWMHDLWLLSTILRFGFSVLLIAVTVAGIRQNRTEALIALPAFLLLALTIFSSDLEVLGIPVSYFPLGIRVGIGDISLFVLIVVVLGLVVRRFLQSRVRQQEMTNDLEQAKEVQLLLVPEQLPQAPGYRVRGTYLPASQVGGDFYQVLPLKDGGLIAVLGDVSGKGLRAAMVVSMVVGAMRALVKQTSEPAEILARLNRELVGNLKGGFVTCVCARIRMEGGVTIANAGHLPPWINGSEIGFPGTLPLGMLADATYQSLCFDLAEGSALTFMSDGVVEARREKDAALFGFDRLAALMTNRATLDEIASAAQLFGQEDDISLLEIMHVPS